MTKDGDIVEYDANGIKPMDSSTSFSVPLQFYDQRRLQELEYELDIVKKQRDDLFLELGKWSDVPSFHFYRDKTIDLENRLGIAIDTLIKIQVLCRNPYDTQVGGIIVSRIKEALNKITSK